MGDSNALGVLGIYLNGTSPRCQQIPSSGSFTSRSWAELVLLYLEYLQAPGPDIGGSPPLLTTNNINNMTVWMNQENAATSWWTRNNPLNSSLKSAPMGLGSYPDLDTAAYYTAMTILLYFPQILGAIDANAPPATFSAAVIQSPWACSHYGVKAAGSDNCTEGNHVSGSPYENSAPNGYWTAGTPTPPDILAKGAQWKWWGDGVPPRGLNFFSTLSIPSEVSAPAGRGANPNATNGVGWDWASPQAYWPNPGTDAPGVPDMSEVPSDLVCIDPTNRATWNSQTGFASPPATGGSTSSSTGGSTGSSTGGVTGSSTGNFTGGVTGTDTNTDTETGTNGSESGSEEGGTGT